jgi:hypothetical protein
MAVTTREHSNSECWPVGWSGISVVWCVVNLPEYPYRNRLYFVIARYCSGMSKFLLKIGSDVLGFRPAPNGEHWVPLHCQGDTYSAFCWAERETVADSTAQWSRHAGCCRYERIKLQRGDGPYQ